MVNRKNLTLIICLVFGQTFYAQKSHPCADGKNKFLGLKSNTLNVQEISLTEQYDVTSFEFDIEMTNLNTSIIGNVIMNGFFKSNEDSLLFELHENLTIDSIYLNGVNYFFSRVNSKVILLNQFAENESFSVQTFYQGTPPDASSNPLGGSGMTNDNSPSWGNQVTWSLSEPFSAFEWFPCKQSLTDKIDSVYMKITVTNNLKAGSNGILIQEEDLGNGKTKFHWKTHYPIANYLISVAVAEYVDYTITANPHGSNPVTIQNFIYNNPNTLPNFINDIDEAADFMEYFSSIYGPYPFANEKYGHCMAPLSGGMEHQTMTTQGFFEKTLTAHELAHQWWGDQVTCKSWADIWVNEGFASYSEYLMLQNLYPSEAVGDMSSRHSNIKSQASGTVWVEDSLNGNRIFSSRLTYDKGAAIIHTLRYLIDNDSLFYAILKEFQETYRFSNASGLDFKEKVEALTGEDYTVFFEDWYFGSGFPTYNVEWNFTNSTLYLNVVQAVSDPFVTDLFDLPVEFRFSRVGQADTIIKLRIDGTSHNFEIQGLSSVSGLVAVDPNNWIINNATVVRNNQLGSNIGIESQVKNEDKIIISNPFGNFVEVNQSYGEVEVTIINTKGEMIYQEMFNDNFKINTTSFAKGSYLLQIKSKDNQFVNRKIIKI